MIAQAWARIAEGGPVAVILLLLAAAVYAVATLRALHLRPGRIEAQLAAIRSDALGATAPRSLRERMAQVARLACERHAGLLRALVVIAPLLGLLGTVSGMVDTFASLHESAVHQGGMNVEAHLEERTVAGGISRALITTQLGLIVAIPGLILERLLARWARRRQRVLEQIIDGGAGDRPGKESYEHCEGAAT